MTQILLLGIYPTKHKTLNQKDICTHTFTAGIFTPKPSSADEGIKKEVLQIYNRIRLSYKKEWKIAIWNNMDGPRGYYAKWNKSDRKANARLFHLYMASKEENKQVEQKKIHIYREHLDSFKMGGGLGWCIEKMKGFRSTNWFL